MRFFKPNVPSWEKNVSLGEEAFNNAKRRFWAEINGLPYDVSLPDPDITWRRMSLGDLLVYLNQPVVCTGWPDAEEDPIRPTEKVKLLGDSLFHLNQRIVCTGWGD
ncbi:hypothetical protein HHK36_019718 [Tetracentron sinense]|uniref:Uncharacterized protein n=1 Tax=Tetracentron sinense TaxID=13715 RepID=A0A834Z2P6_TETSI|nr:hypothetical protein HHK36_019718 [Tetracentron sinense]